MRCGTCKFWEGYDDTFGVCVVEGPKVGSVGKPKGDYYDIKEIAGATFWPVTVRTQRCGCWQDRLVRDAPADRVDMVDLLAIMRDMLCIFGGLLPKIEGDDGIEGKTPNVAGNGLAVSGGERQQTTDTQE